MELTKIPTPAEAASEYYSRRKAERSLHEFMVQAWPWIEAGRPFVDGWHLSALAEHLEAVVRGDILNLLINIPFRLSKSSLVSVMFPAWAWLEYPSLQFLFASYAQNISVRDSRRCRALIQSHWYQARWRERFSIVGDQDTKIRFENDKNGYRIASSVDGQNTGEGGDILCASADTIIITKQGPATIAAIVTARMPVEVLSFNHSTGTREWQMVEQFHDSGMRQVVEIEFDGQRLRCTPNHPIWGERDDYAPAGELGGREVGIERVYNLGVARNRNFFANGILTHNCYDDPNNVKDQSEVMLESTIEWHKNVMSSRLNDFRSGRRIVIQQRVHERDLSGYILENSKQDYVHLMLPMEFELARRCVTVKLPSSGAVAWADPRTKEGELLCPARVGPKELIKIKRDLGSEYAIAGQLQQLPAPAEGGIIKKAWFKIWKEPEPPQLDFTLMSVDTAMTANKSSAFNVATTWGVYRDKDNNPNILLLAMWRDRCEYPELRAMMQRLARDYLDDGPNERKSKKPKRPDLILIEAKMSGLSLIQDLRRAGVYALPINPDKRGDKISRIRLVTPIIEAGRIWLPGKAPRYETWRDWVQPFMSEALGFPNAATRDAVDTMSQALDHLQTFGYSWHPDDPTPIEIPREPDVPGQLAFY